MAKENSKTEEHDNYEKIYIGKGKDVSGMDIVDVSIELTEAIKAARMSKGRIFLNFSVARMQQPDNFGKTHTCYFSKKIQNPEED